MVEMPGTHTPVPQAMRAAPPLTAPPFFCYPEPSTQGLELRGNLRHPGASQLVRHPARPACDRSEFAAFELLTRALMGITARSLQALDGSVSVSQFRLLRTLNALGRVPCTVLAAELGTAASSVTRLAARLTASGLVLRGRHPRKRSVVMLEVTDGGREVVTAVLERRRQLLAAVLDAMDPAERARAAAVAARFAHVALESAGITPGDPVLGIAPGSLTPN